MLLRLLLLLLLLKLLNLLAEQRYCFQQLRTQPTAGAGTFFSCHPTGAPSVAPLPCSSPLPPVPLEPPSSLLLDTSLPARVATKSARRLPSFHVLPLFKSANWIKNYQNLPQHCSYSLVLSLHPVVLRACFSATSFVGADYLADIKSYLFVLFVIPFSPAILITPLLRLYIQNYLNTSNLTLNKSWHRKREKILLMKMPGTRVPGHPSKWHCPAGRVGSGLQDLAGIGGYPQGPTCSYKRRMLR